MLIGINYDIPRGEDNEKVMAKLSNYYHLEYESEVNKICKSKRQKKASLN
jgi:hypothetical protein